MVRHYRVIAPSSTDRQRGRFGEKLAKGCYWQHRCSWRDFGYGSGAGQGLTSWKSGLNHDRIIQIQNEGGTREAADGVEVSYYSNSSFRVVSPRGISIIVDPWRNDPSGAWGLWYHVEYPAAEVDIGMSTHAHFDHDALDKIDANMLLDRMGGQFELGDVKITGIADKHQCVAPGLIPWTEAVKQFEGRDDPCVDNFRHMDNTIYLIETGSIGKSTHRRIAAAVQYTH